MAADEQIEIGRGAEGREDRGLGDERPAVARGRRHRPPGGEAAEGMADGRRHVSPSAGTRRR